MKRWIVLPLTLAAVLVWAAPGVAQVTQPVSPQAMRAGTPTVRTTRADLQALRDLKQLGQKRVAALTAQLAAVPAGPARTALERQVVRAKLETRVEWLSALARWADAHGQAALAAQAQETARRLVQLDQPAVPGPDMPREKIRAPQEVRP